MLFAAGCGGAPSAESAHWIVEPPTRELAFADLRAPDCRFRFHFSGDALPPGVALRDVTRMGEGGAEFSIWSGASSPKIVLQGLFQPADVGAMDVEIHGVRRGDVRLAWLDGATGELRGEARLSKFLGSGEDAAHFRFELGGRIGSSPVRFELEPTTAAGEVVTIGDLCVGRARLAKERVALAGRTAWKVTIADDTRDVLLAAAGEPLVHRSRVARGARLDFGFAMWGEKDRDVRLRVEAGRAGEARRTVLDRLLRGEELRAGWVDLSADLSGVPPGESEIALSARPEPDRGDEFVALWSAPRSISRDTPRDRPNIVLISLDTLRADHLSSYGYARPTSPNLDAFARDRGVLFRRVVAPSGWTLPSHFSLLTGIDAYRHPANYNQVAIDSAAFDFLASLLWNAGYRTAAITGGGFVHPAYGLAKGFESFAAWASKPRRAEELERNLARATRFLEAAPPEPFFLFLHTYEIHSPNEIRQPYFDRMSRLRVPANWIVDEEGNPTSAEEGFLGSHHFVVRGAPESAGRPLAPGQEALPVDAYDSAIAYTDARLAPLLGRLSAPPFDGNTIVAIVSDHGESLGDDGRAGHAYLSLDNLLVPLILSGPGLPRPSGEVTTQVRLVDLAPTLLELARVPAPPGIDGRSLLPLLRGEEAGPGRWATAYAASTNYGLAVLSPSGLKAEWRNSVWGSIAGQLLWYRDDGFRETPLAAAPKGEEVDRMLHLLGDRYERMAIGLRFEMSTTAPGSVGLELESDLIDPASVKSLRVGGPSIPWSRIGTLSTDLRSGKPLELQFERLLRPEVAVSWTVRRTGCARESKGRIGATLSELRVEKTFRFPLPSCDGVPASSLEARLRWQGALPGDSRSAGDPRLEEELRALGYLR